DGVEHRLLALDVEIGVLLAGEARSRQVLCRRRRSYGYVGGLYLVAGRQPGVCLHGLVGDFVWKVRREDELADAGAAFDEVLEVVALEASEQAGDGPFQLGRA